MTLRGENEERIVLRILSKLEKMLENSRPQGRWSFLGLGCEKKWYGTHTHKPDGEWRQDC